MKRLIAGALAAVALSTAARAEETQAKFGVKLGLNYTALTGDTGHAEDLTGVGFAVGARVELGLADMVALETGLLYTQKGAGWGQAFGVAGFNTTLGYIEVPVLMKFSFSNERAYAVAGMALGANIVAEEKTTDVLGTSVTVDVKDDTEDIELCLVVGVGGTSKVGEGVLSAGVQYAMGLTDVSESAATDINTSTVSLMVGYTF
ncbi:MAG: porin family protein [Planctomycetota bacterium]|jgi:hypothetical protein